MKPFFKYLFFVYLAMAVQAIFFKGTKPDFILIIVCFYALRYGQVKGAVFGAVTGLLLDTVSGFVLGPNIISKSIAGLVVSAVRSRVFQWNLLVNTLVVAVLSVTDIFLVYICLETFSKVSFIDRSWGISAVQIIYTTISALILYAVFNPMKDNKEHAYVSFT